MMYDVRVQERRRLLRSFAGAAIFGLALLSCASTIRGQRDRKALERNEAAEVISFANKFLHRLALTKDIRRLPKHLFARPLNETLSGNSAPETTTSETSLTARTRLDRRIYLFDFVYLGILYAARSYKVSGDLELNDIYPPAVIRMISKNPALSQMLELDFDSAKHSLTKSESRNFYRSIPKFNAEMRKYLNSHRGEWLNKYWQIVAGMSTGDGADPYSFLCAGDECGGLPENTRLIHTWAFPFDLYLVNQKGALRILKINPISD